MEKDKISFFEDIYENNKWRLVKSKSGPGSDGLFGLQKINLIQYIINKYKINSILDIGCGDLYWMKQILHNNDINYTGIDVVKKLLNDN